VVRELNARDRNVSSILEDGGNDDLGKILHKVRLEGRLAVVVMAKVVEQLGERVGEGRVLVVLVELVAEELDLIDDAIGVTPILVAQEVVAVVVETVPLVGGLVVQDVALLLEAAADVSVHSLEPILELGVTVGINVDGVDGVPEIVRGGAVGEALKQSLQVLLSLSQSSSGLLDGAR
jgi:hypothetical protein